jgi:hypothetical protein
MNKPRIRIVEFYLKNFAPFYESMGIRDFHFDKRNSPYNLTLIIAANGTGKSFLITELSPESLEHIVGRIANRFISGEDGEKRIHYIVNDTYEYVCTILYDRNHKTTCFFKKIDLETGKEEELNPNGNVSSYQELCHIHLHYNKTFKNIGYITNNVKNVITMSFTERQQLFSTWIPDTSQFLSASKMVQKKINTTKKEIENLIADITRISISSYKENLINLKSNLSVIEKDLLFYRDHISKINLLLGSFSKYERELLQEHIFRFKERIKVHNNNIHKNKEVFASYGAYLTDRGEKKLAGDLSALREKKATIEGRLNLINDKISMLDNAIGRIKSTNESPLDDGSVPDLNNIVSGDAGITSIKDSLEQLDITIHDTLETHTDFKDVLYSDDLRDAIKNLITVFLLLYQMGNTIIQACDGFTLNELFKENSTLISGQTDILKALNEQNKILGDLIESLRKHEKEMSKLSIDESFLSFIPQGCGEDTCSLIKELKSRINYNPYTVQKEIDEKTLVLEEIREKLSRLGVKSAAIEKIISDQSRMNAIVIEQEKKIVLLPGFIYEKIMNKNRAEFICSINTIVNDLQHLDEYISLLEKKKAGNESIRNLLNIYKLLKQNDTLNNDLAQYLEDRKVLFKDREEVVKELTGINLRIEKLSRLNESIVNILKEKEAIDKECSSLEEERAGLLQENQNLYYKITLCHALSTFKNKETDLMKNETMMKNEIERCSSIISNRALLEQKKEALEGKLRIYEILYAVWNPRTGYPSMLIKDFLDEVSFVTNNSLDNIWGGLIRIKEFRIDENEFRIPIIRGNTVLEDISECSTAEKNTLALAISLAIIQVSTSYNIVRLDEVDGGFDESRRQSFLEMITQQLVTAGCEDGYIITHNQYFENIPCNVILLKGYELLVSGVSLENKNVLYKYPSI